jgi:transposase
MVMARVLYTLAIGVAVGWLQMPCLEVTQHNPVIRWFYQRLISQGKTKMVALIAAMRKLLTILNVTLKKNED